MNDIRGAVGLAWRGERSVTGLSWSRLETDCGLPGPGEDPGELSDIRIDQQQDRFDLRSEWSGLDGFLTDATLRVAYGDYEHAELEGAEIGTRFRQQGVDARAQVGHAPVAGWRGTVGAQHLALDLGSRCSAAPSTTSTRWPATMACAGTSASTWCVAVSTQAATLRKCRRCA